MPLPSVYQKALAAASFAAPTGVAYDAARTRLLVVNTGANELRWADPTTAAPAFAAVGSFGTTSTAEGFATPLALAVEATGGLIVLDTGNGELDRYTYDQAGDAYVYDAGFLGGNRKSFAGLTLLQASDVKLVGGDLYVLDGGRGRIVKVDVAAGMSSVAATDTSWSGASGLAVDAAGTIFVADTQNHRIRRYSVAGAAHTIGAYGSAPGQLKLPRGLLLDAAGNLFVADSGNQRVQVFAAATGAHVAIIGAAPQLGSVRGLVLDGDTLYVADSAKNAVHVFAPAAAGPILRLGSMLRDFGSVGVGYAADLPVVLHNDGSAALNVSGVTPGDPAFTARTTTLQIAPGASSPLVLRFSPTAAGAAATTVTIASDSSTGATAAVAVRGVGFVPPLVDAILVLDRSGSMHRTAGAQSKMAALQQAAQLFVDLARGGVGDRIGLVEFDHQVQTKYPLTAVSDTPPSTRDAAKVEIAALTPRGATSIGGGLEQARANFAAATGQARKVIVLVTDGMENQAPFVKLGGPNDPKIDLNLYSGFTIYSVGLGLGAEVDLGVLTSVATTTRGAFYLTEDRWLTLSKFFVEIFGDTLDEFVTLDPEFEVVGTQPVELAVDLGEVDNTATFVLYWGDPGVTLDLQLVTPTGAVVNAGTPVAQPVVRGGQGPTWRFYRFKLPLPQALGSGWEGTWKLIVSGNLPAAQRVKFGVSVIVASNLGIDCGIRRNGDATGQPVEFEAQLVAYGEPIEPTSVSLEIDQPAYGRGALYSDMQGNGDADIDYGNDAIRNQLAWAVENDPRFSERTRGKLKVATDWSSGTPMLRATLPKPTAEGSYHYRFVAFAEVDGITLRRECAHSFAVIAYPSQVRTLATAAAGDVKGKLQTYVVHIRPADELGNSLGPGLAPEIQCTVSAGRVGQVQDLGDGTYEIEVRTPRTQSPSGIVLRLVQRGRELKWTLDQLLEPTPTRQKRRPRPRPDSEAIG